MIVTVEEISLHWPCQVRERVVVLDDVQALSHQAKHEVNNYDPVRLFGPPDDVKTHSVKTFDCTTLVLRVGGDREEVNVLDPGGKVYRKLVEQLGKEQGILEV